MHWSAKQFTASGMILKTKRIATMIRLSLFAFTTLFLLGCDRADFRNGHSPGEIELIDNGRVFHLADGVFIEEKKTEGSVYYLIESTVVDYDLTKAGLDIELGGDKAGSYSTTPAPQGYVAAWISLVPGEGPELTRFRIEDEILAKLLRDFTAATKVRDIYKLKQ